MYFIRAIELIDSDSAITRLLYEDRDLLADFGATDEESETLAETVARRKERSRQRIDDLAESRDDAEA